MNRLLQRRCLFVYMPLLFFLFGNLYSVDVANASATGSISAGSQHIYCSSGMGTTTISWTTSGLAVAQVYVNMDNRNDMLMAESTTGTSTVGWIQPGHSYVFKLFSNRDRLELLDSVTVVGYSVSAGNIAVFETEAIASRNGGNASVEITWGVNGYSTSEVYVSQDGGAEVLMARTLTGNVTAPWIVPGHRYDFNLYADTGHATLLDSVTVYGRRHNYDVGIDYHATGADFDTTSFLRDYHLPAVRPTVQSQLQNMADRGIRIINTHIWLVVTNGNPPEKWKWNFPPSNAQLTNLTTFSSDVAAIQAADGHRLKLDITIGCLWSASYSYGSPETTLGYENLTAADYVSRMTASYQGIIDSVSNVYRPDGHRVANIVYLLGEALVPQRPNEEWYLLTHYPGFVDYCNLKGVQPSIYFSAVGSEAEVLDDAFTDGTYPVLNGHRSMYWVYRTIKFLRDNDLYIPERIDVSAYPNPVTSDHEALVRRIFDDADATLPSLGCRKWYSVVETFYPADNTDRENLGAALARDGLRNNRLSSIGFWTTPDSGGWGIHAGYPFEVEDYLP